MPFNVTPTNNQETKDRVYFDLKGSSAIITNARVVTPHFISFTLRCKGFSLYGLRLVEFENGENAGKLAILMPQTKANNGKYYENYKVYFRDEDIEWLITKVSEAASYHCDIAYDQES